MRRKICFIVTNLNNTGPINVLYGLIKNLDFKRYQILILTLRKQKNSLRIKEFKKINKNIKIISLNTNKYFLILFFNYFLKKIKFLLKQEQVDIIHTNCFISTFIASKLNNIKKISTIHCNLKMCLVSDYGYLVGRILNKIYRNSLKKMDKIINCGKSLMKENNLSEDYIMNGVEVDNRIKGVDIDTNKLNIIVVNRLVKIKNTDYILKTFSKINNINDKINLFIIGDGKELNKLKKIYKKEKFIYFLGKKTHDEVQKWLKSTDIFISASLTEGMPLGVLEAASLNNFCLLSNIPPHIEILDIIKYRGRIFNIVEEDSLEKELKKLKKINKNETSQIRYLLSAKRMSKQYMEIYDKI